MRSRNSSALPVNETAATGPPSLEMRSYRAGDETRVVALWNHAYTHYAGLAARTVEYWRWSILDRPAMAAEDILLIEAGERLVGYAAPWSGGRVLELAVEPQLGTVARRAVVRQLLQGLEAHARARAWDTIELMLPTCDRLVDRTLRASGYIVVGGPTMIVRLLNPEALLRTLCNARTARLATLHGWKLLLTLTAGDDPFLLQHRLYLQFGEPIEVRAIGDEEAAPDSDAELRLCLASLAELVFCGADARRMLRTGELHLAPAAAAGRAMLFLQALTVNAPWYTPWSDTF